MRLFNLILFTFLQKKNSIEKSNTIYQLKFILFQNLLLAFVFQFLELYYLQQIYQPYLLYIKNLNR